MECPYIPLTPYSDFSLRLHEQAAGKRIPLVGSLEVTERCNLGCAHCYINLPAGDYGARRRELRTRENSDPVGWRVRTHSLFPGHVFQMPPSHPGDCHPDSQLMQFQIRVRAGHRSGYPLRLHI